jgi:hypothetical protein
LAYQQPPKERPVTPRVVLLVIAFYLGVIACLVLPFWIIGHWLVGL